MNILSCAMVRGQHLHLMSPDGEIITEYHSYNAPLTTYPGYTAFLNKFFAEPGETLGYRDEAGIMRKFLKQSLKFYRGLYGREAYVKRSGVYHDEPEQYVTLDVDYVHDQIALHEHLLRMNHFILQLDS